MMPTPSLTVDELVATLKHSRLATVLVEGDDDLIVYRWIEEKIGVINASVLSCNGRNNLLAVYERRSEFLHLKTVFVADKDMWIFTTIPAEYSDNIVWTTGYSIENDLYAGANIERLLNSSEKNGYNELVKNVTKWFAFEVEQYRNNLTWKIDFHPNQICTEKKVQVSEIFLESRCFTTPSELTIKEIESDYQLKLRGKLLIDLFTYYYNSVLNCQAYYNTKTLFDLCLKFPDHNSYLEKIINEICSGLGITT
jgi:hypothetical protein